MSESGRHIEKVNTSEDDRRDVEYDDVIGDTNATTTKSLANDGLQHAHYQKNGQSPGEESEQASTGVTDDTAKPAMVDDPEHEESKQFPERAGTAAPGLEKGSIKEHHAIEQVERQALDDITKSDAVGPARSAEYSPQRLYIARESELPASPPPPSPPQKDAKSDCFISQSKHDGKQLSRDEQQADVPDALQGTAESTGAEILTIMDQFQSGTEAPGEEEIMSPRRDRQQSVLILPPRSSSLEPKDTFALSHQMTGQSSKSTGSTRRSDAPTTNAVPGLEHVKSEDTMSIASSKAASIFHPPPADMEPEPEPVLPFDFHRFLEQLRHRTADPVARFLRSFLTEFGKKQWMVHEQVKIISDFLEFIAKKMAICEVWRTVSDAEFDNAREGMEKLVMNRLYSQTFSPAIPPPGSPRKTGRGGRSQADVASPIGLGRRGQHQEDVERDDVIAQKIRIYGWIREEHLDIPSVGEKGQKFLTLAQQELLKIGTYRAPRDKVICVLNCCKVIFGFLKNAKSDQGADSFVPLLIYTVLRARPEHLVSNVQYIWRFRNQDKLGGEAGYYMSSLMGVISFIENLDRTNLTISDEEFEINVEQAVSAIAEENKSEEYENKVHSTVLGAGNGGLVGLVGGTGPPMQHLSEKGALSRAEVTPRNSMDAVHSSPRRNATTPARNLNQMLGEKTPASDDDDDMDAVTGLLRTIQKPLSSIGRMFSDEQSSQPSAQNLMPRAKSRTRGLSPSPNPRTERTSSSDGRSPQRSVAQTARPPAGNMKGDPVAAQAAEDQRVRVREHRVVVETLQSMFPNLDKELIEDVVRAQEGNVGRAVDACLALSG
nr:vacuolar protein sorting-associated protein 9a [Quercus suber]